MEEDNKKVNTTPNHMAKGYLSLIMALKSSYYKYKVRSEEAGLALECLIDIFDLLVDKIYELKDGKKSADKISLKIEKLEYLLKLKYPENNLTIKESLRGIYKDLLHYEHMFGLLLPDKEDGINDQPGKKF